MSETEVSLLYQPKTKLRRGSHLTSAELFVYLPVLNSSAHYRPVPAFYSSRHSLFIGVPLLPFTVGYQNKSLNPGFNYVANTFVPVGVGRSEMTLGDIVPNGEFISSSIQFLTTGGATAKVNDANLGEVYATYIYWTAEDEPVGGAGWYFSEDDTATYNQNNRVVPFGDAYCVDRDGGEEEAALTYAGEVQTTAVTKSFVSGFNYVGNCCPKNLTLGDITPNGEFISSSIQFLTSGGATAKANNANLGEVYATYIYWTAEDEPVGGAGWYFSEDDTATYNQNSRPIAAGEAFCVDRDGGEDNAAITIPAALGRPL